MNDQAVLRRLANEIDARRTAQGDQILVHVTLAVRPDVDGEPLARGLRERLGEMGLVGVSVIAEARGEGIEVERLDFEAGWS